MFRQYWLSLHGAESLVHSLTSGENGENLENEENAGSIKGKDKIYENYTSHILNIQKVFNKLGLLQGSKTRARSHFGSKSMVLIY